MLQLTAAVQKPEAVFRATALMSGLLVHSFLFFSMFMCSVGVRQYTTIHDT